MPTRGRFASVRGRHSQAANFYRQAVAIEDKVPYMEPPWWYYPVRQSLGSALYRAGRFDQAREAFTGALRAALHELDQPQILGVGHRVVRQGIGKHHCDISLDTASTAV